MIQPESSARTTPIGLLFGPKELTSFRPRCSGGSSEQRIRFVALATSVDIAVDILEVLTRFTYLPHMGNSN